VSRYLCPVALPDGHDADSVEEALFGAVKDLPAHLRKSLTWDQEAYSALIL
jgi:IS30 family transposase